MNILEACADPHLFAPWFKRGGIAWAPWLAFLATLFGLPIASHGHELVKACTGRSTLPQGPFKEATLICGRRAGKSFILALIAVFLAAFRDYREYLAPGERGFIVIIATDRRQARTILNYIKGLFENIPMLRALLDGEPTLETINLTNGLSIEIMTASFRTIRGRTIVAALGDEIAFWRADETSANPDAEIMAALRPAMATIPQALLLKASSPYARRGEQWRDFRKHFGKDDARLLVWKAATRTMNPTIPQSLIDEAYEEDPASAAAEYGAEFRSDIESFISREALESCIVSGRIELPPISTARYSAFCDPSGGSADSMTLAIGHLEKSGAVVVDAIRERKPPFSPDAVVAEFAELLKAYRIRRIVGDRYAGEWPRERFSVQGITYDAAAQPKSALYQNLLPTLNGAKIELPDNARLIAQLAGLERRTARGGKDSIDHAPGAHDDLANVIAGLAATVAGARSRLDYSKLCQM